MMEDVGVMQQNIPLIEILEPTLQRQWPRKEGNITFLRQVMTNHESGLEVKRGDRDNPTSYQPP